MIVNEIKKKPEFLEITAMLPAVILPNLNHPYSVLVITCTSESLVVVSF